MMNVNPWVFETRTEYIPCLYTNGQLVALLVDNEAFFSKAAALSEINEARKFYPPDQRFVLKRVVTEYAEVL